MSIEVVSVRLYTGEPLRSISAPDSPERRDLDRRMTRAQFGAKRFVRKRTGTLAASIRKRAGVDGRGPYVAVVAGWTGNKPVKSYVQYEHDGTHPHIIRPRRRKALRFQVNGQVVFAQRVKHPGTRGSKFLTRALPLAGGN